MPGFNGNGLFERTHNWVSDKNAGVNITAARMDAEFDGVAAGLSNCVTKDGQTTVAANLGMAGFRHTGVSNAALRDQYAAAGQVQDQALIWGGTSGGTANAHTIATAPVTAAYAAGQAFEFVAGSTNTAPCTLNVNGLGAKSVRKTAGGVLVDLASGDLQANIVQRVTYNGTHFQLMSARPHSQGADVASAATLNLGTATGDLVDVTGTTTVTAITLPQGLERTVRFAGALTLTHGAGLVLPGGANVATAAGDFATFRGYASGVVRCTAYSRASGNPVAAQPAFSAHRGGVNQTAPAGATTKIEFTAEDFDTGGGFDTASLFRWTPATPGKYLLTLCAGLTAINPDKPFYAIIAKNGTGIAQAACLPGATLAPSAAVSVVADTNGTSDYFEGLVFNGDAVPQAVDGQTGVTRFTGARVGP